VARQRQGSKQRVAVLANPAAEPDEHMHAIVQPSVKRRQAESSSLAGIGGLLDQACSGSADRCSRTRDRIGRDPCSDSGTSLSGVMPTALQRAESSPSG
jgi:hypothetical protein